MRSVIALVFLSLLIHVPSAFAGPITECMALDQANDHYRVAFESLPPGGRTTLYVNGAMISRKRDYCLEDQGGLRCPHRENGIDYEVYPRFAGDRIEKIWVLIHDGRGTRSVELKECS